MIDAPTMPDAGTNEHTKDRTTTELAEYAGKHRATIYEWLTDGIQTPAGPVKLKGKRKGGFWYSSYAAVEDFFDTLTRLSSADPVSETPAAVEERARKDQSRARKKLGGKWEMKHASRSCRP